MAKLTSVIATAIESARFGSDHLARQLAETAERVTFCTAATSSLRHYGLTVT
ncbi:hypothetical protein ACIG87_03005 [Micromonospora sp. NPDC051925]|uniref:hypothetical protein n=1 Tax=Micromonospora sp. NPDC051925 TaxID=3364288 RepID=UPI0037CC63A0